MKYRISVKATLDIESIWLYTLVNWSEAQANHYINLIFSEINTIAQNPEFGTNYGSIRKKYRCYKVKSHPIFYKVYLINKPIEIIRILHERMDVESRLYEK
jgi:toxin ParE1/3/4